MSEPIEDIIIIEESDAAGFDSDVQDDESSSEKINPKQKLIILGAAAGIFLLLMIIIIILLIPSSENKQVISMDYIEEKLEEEIPTSIEPSKLENMIAKANYLYSTGSKQEALFLYEKIAVFSEAISQYNLGVAQLKGDQYAIALKTFQRAIVNDENRCVSAINAAVCSLHLEDENSFRYYLDLAHAYLPREIDSPLYSYYYALINYYNGSYLEALSALNNPTSKDYPKTQKHLSAKINALFGNNYDALESMDYNPDEMDVFSMGLLYAKIGDLTLARKNLEDAIVKNIEPVKASLSLALINIKAGQVKTAADQIKNITDMFPEEVYKHYPIKVKLKKSLFDPEKAQNRFRNFSNVNNLITYQKIFYYSPYKIFNSDQTISYIRKGNANIYIDNVASAQNYLMRSEKSSNVNKGIAKAINKALEFRIRQANEELLKLSKIQPKHSILHYNLALTYAQLGNMIEAHKHFLKSYHLDAKNYLSGIYAIMSGELVNKKHDKLKSIIKGSIMREKHSEDIDLYNTLLYITDNNFLATSDWLDLNYKERPFYLALDVIISLKLNRLDVAKDSANKLTKLLPNDILPHLMKIDVDYSQLAPKEYANSVLNYLKLQNFDFNDLYYGPSVTRYLYIQQNLIIGKLYFLRQQLKGVLESTSESTHELTSALALTSLYNQNFEESYTLYNQLIDDLKVRDAYTLFLGAVASTAAQHHENAIVLLELSKMKDTNFLESRYALGLLYLEVKNNQGASIQLSRVGNHGFNSEFFNFNIDTDMLLFEKQYKK